ncbi:hypothetical protein ACOSQ2_014355 [Xanthoceras sorbifolium]
MVATSRSNQLGESCPIITITIQEPFQVYQGRVQLFLGLLLWRPRPYMVRNLAAVLVLHRMAILGRGLFLLLGRCKTVRLLYERGKKREGYGKKEVQQKFVTGMDHSTSSGTLSQEGMKVDCLAGFHAMDVQDHATSNLTVCIFKPGGNHVHGSELGSHAQPYTLMSTDGYKQPKWKRRARQGHQAGSNFSLGRGLLKISLNGCGLQNQVSTPVLVDLNIWSVDHHPSLPSVEPLYKVIKAKIADF